MEAQKMRDYCEQEVDAIEMFQNILLGVALELKNNNRYFNN